MDTRQTSDDMLNLVVLLGTADFEAQFFHDEHSRKLVKDRVHEAYQLAIKLRRQVFADHSRDDRMMERV